MALEMRFCNIVFNIFISVFISTTSDWINLIEIFLIFAIDFDTSISSLITVCKFFLICKRSNQTYTKTRIKKIMAITK